MKTVGIVLAGGLSSRFGSPKAFARLRGQYFYEYAIKALQSSCAEIVVVTREELLDRFPSNITVTTDILEFAGCGPLAGILSAMEFVEADRYIVMPCDMPYVDEEVIENLVAQHEHDVTAVSVKGRLHPLLSVWDHELKALLRKTLCRQRFKVMEVLDSVHTTFIESERLTDKAETVFANMNTPADLKKELKTIDCN